MHGLMVADLSSQGQARLRGVVMSMLHSSLRTPAKDEMVLIHLFARLGTDDEPRTAVYVVDQPLDLRDDDLDLDYAAQRALAELVLADHDPRGVARADQRWRTVDPDRQAGYLGSGVRITTRDPHIGSMHEFCLNDGTAIWIMVDQTGALTTAAASNPYSVGDKTFPGSDVPLDDQDPYLLARRIVGALTGTNQP